MVLQRLHQVKLFAHNTLESLNEGAITTHQQGILTSINAAAIALLRIDPECVCRPIATISRQRSRSNRSADR
jgi:hypothetical protein